MPVNRTCAFVLCAAVCVPALCRGTENEPAPNTNLDSVVIFDSPEETVKDIDYAPNGRLIAFGTGTSKSKGYLYLYDAVEKRQLNRYDDFEGQVYRVSFSPDSTMIAASSGVGQIQIMSCDTGNVLKRHSVKYKTAPVQFAPVGGMLIAGDGDDLVLWSSEDWLEIARLKGHERGVISVACSFDGKTLASGSMDHTIRIWDIASRKQVAVLGPDDNETASSVAFAHDNSSVFTGESGQSASQWNLITKQLEHRYKTSDQLYSWEIAASRTGLLAISNRRSIVVYDIKSREKVAILRAHKSVVNALAFSPDGRTLVSGSWDKTVRRWKMD